MTNAIEANINIAAFPSFGHGKGTAIRSYRVLLRPSIGEPSRTVGHYRVCRFIVRERIAGITVKRLVPRLPMIQSPHLPAGGHVDVGPRCIVEVLRAPFILGISGYAHPLEFPHTIQRLIPRRQRHIVLCYGSITRHRNGHRMCHLSVYTGH